jgi:hypothetical protein
VVASLAAQGMTMLETIRTGLRTGSGTDAAGLNGKADVPARAAEPAADVPVPLQTRVRPDARAT